MEFSGAQGGRIGIDDLPPETFAEVVARMRNRQKGLTQAKLGDRVGRSAGQVVAWEKGSEVPEADVFPKLAAALGIPLTALRKLAGLDPGEVVADPVLAGLADQADDLGRRLRALSTERVREESEAPPLRTVADFVAGADRIKKRGRSGPKRRAQ